MAKQSNAFARRPSLKPYRLQTCFPATEKKDDDEINKALNVKSVKSQSAMV